MFSHSERKRLFINIHVCYTMISYLPSAEFLCFLFNYKTTNRTLLLLQFYCSSLLKCMHCLYNCLKNCIHKRCILASVVVSNLYTAPAVEQKGSRRTKVVVIGPKFASSALSGVVHNFPLWDHEWSLWYMVFKTQLRTLEPILSETLNLINCCWLYFYWLRNSSVWRE